MDKDSTGQFVLGSDNALEGREIYQEQLQRKIIDKLSLRVTLISILIPCAIGILLAYFTMDMRSRLKLIENAGSVEMSKFEEQLNLQLETLKTENTEFQKNMEAKITERVAVMDKSLSSLHARTGKTEKDLGNLSSLKAGNDSISAELRTLRAETQTLKKDLAALSAQNSKLTKTIGDIQKKGAGTDLAAIKSANDALKQDIARLKADSIDKGDLAAELKKQKVFYQLEIQELSAKYDKKLQAVGAGSK